MAGRQPPVSFKTVPGRNKTQKWQTAKTYNYDGDDWGGYDPYDEYGDDAPPPPPVPQQPQQPQYGQQQGYGQLPRKNSFDNDDERRNFSAGPVMYGGDNRWGGSPARSNVGGGDYTSDGRPRSRPRDFTNPEQVPSPLNTRSSPAPASFPPRKSSVSGGSPAPETMPMPATRKQEKDLPVPPVVRPSDIYKRMEAEREKERQSMEGSRPSMDSLQRETSAPGQAERPLSSVREDFGEPVSKASISGPPMLPSMRNLSGIGTSFLHGSSEADQTPTRAAPGNDPAAEILAERAPTRAQPGSDPAAEILAERGHDQGIDEPESGVEHHFDGLQHQPSQSYRSVVDQAFDDESAVPSSSSLSRDSSVYSQSVGGNGPSRANSNSTAGISPIMSRVPSAATAKMQQQQRDAQVPTIAEEPSQRMSSDQTILRKPSPLTTPGHSRNVSDGSNDLVQPGYRRSFDPPSSDNSPARTPGLENASSRRPSRGLAAETDTVEPPTVPDQGVEMMPALEPGETPLGEMPTSKPLPSIGRARAGTDYSMRESDIAHEASTSPENGTYSSAIAQVASAEQTAFLQDHAGTPTSPYPPATASGRSSPGKGRVRDLAGKYQTIEAESRRGSTTSSKSSWSNFRGSTEDLPGQGIKKRSTGEKGFGAELTPSTSETRPAAQTQMSFRPGLPGQWVSYAGTPGESPGPVAEPQNLRDIDEGSTLQEPPQDEVPDLTPTTKKHQLSGHSPSSPQQGGALSQVKGAGEALGASLLSSVGIGHQTRDFASKETPAPVEQPSAHRQTGAMGFYNSPERPELSRGDTDGTTVTDVGSATSSEQPTPLNKDTPTGPGLLNVRGVQEDRPISNYFSSAVAPLQPNKGRAPSSLDQPKFGPTTNMSTATGEYDTESDRLRKEIVKSLTPSPSREDAMLTQDALDAPDNMRKVEAEQDPEPAAEASKPSLALLNQRFSWEDRPQAKGALDSSPAGPQPVYTPIVREPDPDPEIRPEYPYERPRSRGLHIMNAEAEESSDDDRAPQTQSPQRSLFLGDNSLVSPLTRSQEALDTGSQSRDISLDDAAASSSGLGVDVDDRRESDATSTTRVPSYYTQNPDTVTKDTNNAPSLPASPAQTPVLDASPNSPTAAKPPPTAKSTIPPNKIPPFREILAVKSPEKRMQLYTSTRQQFADTETGLDGWVAGMLEKHPEHAGKAPNPQLEGLRSASGGVHKHSASIVGKLSRGMGTNSFAGGPAGAPSAGAGASGAGSGSGGVGGNKDEKWEQRGKELMKGASVFGGKAQAGAKGLLMKGRSRFGTKRESSGTGREV